MNAPISLKDRTRKAVLAIEPVRKSWGEYKRRRLVAAYRHRRDSYARTSEDLGLRYSEQLTTAATRSRLSKRGYSVPARTVGSVSTYAFVPAIGWHEALLPDLQRLGHVERFDYTALGYRWEEFAAGNAEGLRRRAAMNDAFVKSVLEAHRRRPLDWVFVYASGTEVSASSIERLISEIGVPIVNMCLDDKQSWSGPWLGDHHGGQIALAPVFDLSWTSARVACEWYLVEGGRPLYLPEGFDTTTFFPEPAVQQDIDISFIGAHYGFRPTTLAHLKSCNLRVDAFGPGWSNGSAWGPDQLRIINRSRINLGLGGIGYSEELTNVKTRDFEIPAVGRGLYLTSFNADLAQHFDVGSEIVCYRGWDELVELARHYLKNDDERNRIAHLGRQRCLGEHRWLHRYIKVCTVLGILSATAADKVGT